MSVIYLEPQFTSMNCFTFLHEQQPHSDPGHYASGNGRDTRRQVGDDTQDRFNADAAADQCGMLAQRLRRTYELLQDATFETLEVRLARQIVYLAASEGRPTPQGVRLTHRLRQADLADLLGATTRSIITILNAWRAAGLVVYDTERAFLTVTDIAAMRAIVETNV